MNLFDLSKEISPTYTAKFWRAVLEFNLIEKNDKIALGFSGGKDSIYLLFLLSSLKEKFPFPFEVEALHIENGFASPEENQHMREKLSKYCDELKIPLTIHPLPMEEIWDSKKEKSPCFICARYRRGALPRIAKEKGFNKLALAHHLDDAVETFMMSLFQSGQIKTFAPRAYMDRSDITVIRPLCFLRETEVIDAMTKLPWEPIKNPCPYSESTKRMDTRNWLKEQEEIFPGLFQKLSRSLREDQVKDLWPPLPNRKELKEKFEAFWGK